MNIILDKNREKWYSYTVLSVEKYKNFTVKPGTLLKTIGHRIGIDAHVVLINVNNLHITYNALNLSKNDQETIIEILYLHEGKIKSLILYSNDILEFFDYFKVL